MPNSPDDLLEWSPVAVFNNFEVDGFVGNDFARITNIEADFLKDLNVQNDRFQRLSNSFQDQFGGPVFPSFLVFNRRFSDRHTNGAAILAFRDLAAISFLLHGRAAVCRNGSTFGNAVWANTFEIYPWMIGRDLSSLVANTPAFMGFHDLAKLSAQSSPEVNHLRLDTGNLDRYIFEALLEVWTRRFVVGPRVPVGGVDQLFRSLQMAFHASKMPTNSMATHWDVGRVIALWVSAFEILFFDPLRRDSSNVVAQNLTRFHFDRRALRQRRYSWNFGSKGVKKMSLVEKTYRTLHAVRNDYLHGNPVTPGKLKPRGFERALLVVTTVVYWIALHQKLGEIGRPVPPICQTLDEKLTIGIDYLFEKHRIEDALIASGAPQPR